MKIKVEELVGILVEELKEYVDSEINRKSAIVYKKLLKEIKESNGSIMLPEEKKQKQVTDIRSKIRNQLSGGTNVKSLIENDNSNIIDNSTIDINKNKISAEEAYKQINGDENNVAHILENINYSSFMKKIDNHEKNK